MTLTRGRRPLVVILAWLTFGLLQAASMASIDPSSTGDYVLFHGAIALVWAILTLGVGGWMLSDPAESWVARALRHALGLLICALIDTLIRRVLASLLGSAPTLPWYGTLLYFADRSFVGYVAIVLVTHTLAAHDRFVARQRQSLSLRADLARARLASLEEQLHPHVLFNCLGAVTELAYEAPAKAARMLRQLAAVLLFAVERRSSEVTVDEEIEALEAYLDVQRMRFSDWLTIETRVDQGAGVLLMPPLVLQPLVENAIRHGLTRRDAPGAIVVSASVRDDALVLEVRDNGVGLRTSGVGGGLGTTNVRDRLSTLYGNDGRLLVFEDVSGGVTSQVTLPAHARADATADVVATTAGEPLLSSTLRRWPVGSVAILWAIWGLLWTQQSIAYLALRGRLADRSIGQIIGQDFMLTMIWAALTPLMLLMGRLVPITGRRFALRLAAHGAAAVAIAVLHEWIARRWLGATSPAINSESITMTAWGVIAYAIVLGAAHHGRIQGWLRERELADARLKVEIAEAELEDTWSRTRPQQLLDRLEAIARSIEQDAASAERMLTGLGDQLRESLGYKVPA